MPSPTTMRSGDCVVGSMSRKADPRCTYCDGRGGERYGTRWVTCVCVNGTAAQRAAVRRLHSVGATRDPQLSLLTNDNAGGANSVGHDTSNERGSVARHRPAATDALSPAAGATQHRRFCACFDCTEARYGTDDAHRYYGWTPPSAAHPGQRHTSGTQVEPGATTTPTPIGE